MKEFLRVMLARKGRLLMAEVSRKYSREGAKRQTIYARLEAIASASTINPIGIELALEATECHKDLSRQPERRNSEPQAFLMPKL